MYVEHLSTQMKGGKVGKQAILFQNYPINMGDGLREGEWIDARKKKKKKDMKTRWPCVGSSTWKPEGTGLCTLQEGLLIPPDPCDLEAPSHHRRVLIRTSGSVLRPK